MCMVRRMVGAQVYSVVRWLFGCGLVVDGFAGAIVLSFLAMPGLCCFLRVTQRHSVLGTSVMLICSIPDLMGGACAVNGTLLKPFQHSVHSMAGERMDKPAQARVEQQAVQSLPVAPPLPASDRREAVKANITVVRTGYDFQAAVSSGSQDVEIRSHLDLTQLTPDHFDQIPSSEVLKGVAPTTRSIRVRFCDAACCPCMQVPLTSTFACLTMKWSAALMHTSALFLHLLMRKKPH